MRGRTGYDWLYISSRGRGCEEIGCMLVCGAGVSIDCN